MAPDESLSYIILHVFVGGDDIYVGMHREDEEDGGEGQVGGDPTWSFTDPYVSAEEAEADLLATRAAYRARRSLPTKKLELGSIPVHEGTLLAWQPENGERIVASFGQYSVIVFNEDSSDEYFVVFGPGNVPVSDGPVNEEGAMALAEKLADEQTASIEDEFAPPAP